jgi:ATP-dependent Lhr-like helicase
VNAFERLDPLVQHHIVNTLGWRTLRPLQEQSIEPIQDGEHCLLLAPTAGGKTEAAILPILSRLCSENWTGSSVLYICPLRALLNNLHVRLKEYCNMVGRRCGLWHGDVSESERNRIRRENPDILLTTPESLEVMLISARSEGRELLKGVRLVVIDEIHAFAGDDRAGIFWPFWSELVGSLVASFSGSVCRRRLEIRRGYSNGWRVTARAPSAY